MVTEPICDACKGTGRIARQGNEAEKELHPYLAATEGLCIFCGGSGIKPKPTRATIREAAKAQPG